MEQNVPSQEIQEIERLLNTFSFTAEQVGEIVSALADFDASELKEVIIFLKEEDERLRTLETGIAKHMTDEIHALVQDIRATQLEMEGVEHASDEDSAEDLLADVM